MDQFIQRHLMSASEVASQIDDGEVLGVSGFTPSGYPKVIPPEIAKKAERLHQRGVPFKISLYSGASVGDEIDGALARAQAVSKRMPYQTNESMREAINRGEVEYSDLHLSHMAQYLRYGAIPKVTTAIVECGDLTRDGKIFLTTSSGMSPTYLQNADRIFLELNESSLPEIMQMHDVYIPADPPFRKPIPIEHVLDRVGAPYVQVDPSKICGIVLTNKIDAAADFRDPGSVERAIAENLMEFLLHERKKGRLPQGLPFQAGVGNIANAVLGEFAANKNFGPISLYTEVLQDSFFKIHDAGKLIGASTTALTLSKNGNERLRKEIADFAKKIVIRPQEISNNPEVIRRLGVISLNTAMEIDIFGNVNSTHILGSRLMNGIGGSGDFCRNAYLSAFLSPSTSKGEAISHIVPMVSHVDHSEHSVQLLVTERGVSDIRGRSPKEKAEAIIKSCAHPDYQPILNDYLTQVSKNSSYKHTPQLLAKAFEMHERLERTGSMR